MRSLTDLQQQFHKTHKQDSNSSNCFFKKKKKKTRCRPEAPLERLTPLKIEVDIKKIISTVKAVKLGFLKLLNLHEDVRSSNQPRLCFVYHLHYYNISRATSWLEGVRGGALKM